MTNTPFLSIVGAAKALEPRVPTLEEKLGYQAKLLGLWEQQQRVLGYTEASIANNSRNLDIFLKLSGKCIWEVTMHDLDRFYEQLVGRGLAYSTRRKYQSAITTFLDSLRSRDLADLPCGCSHVLDKFNRHVHRHDDREDAVTPPQPEVLERFWAGMKGELATARKFAPIARDYALYRLLALAGLRINEAVMLDVKDCRFDLGQERQTLLEQADFDIREVRHWIFTKPPLLSTSFLAVAQLLT